MAQRALLVAAKFISNSAPSAAGAIDSGIDGSAAAKSVLTLNGATFTSNRSGLGGAVVLAQSGDSIVNCIFDQNVATSSGGAVATFGGGAAYNLTTSTFVANNAASRGGAVYIASGDLVNFKTVSATGNGSSTPTGRDAYNAGTLRIDSTSTVGNIAGPGTVIRN